jgi:hypothetical protein
MDSMKILFLNSTDCRGGAAKSAVRLLDAVRNSGADAEMHSQEQGLGGGKFSDISTEPE